MTTPASVLLLARPLASIPALVRALRAGALAASHPSSVGSLPTPEQPGGVAMASPAALHDGRWGSQGFASGPGSAGSPQTPPSSAAEQFAQALQSKAERQLLEMLQSQARLPVGGAGATADGVDESPSKGSVTGEAAAAEGEHQDEEEEEVVSEAGSRGWWWLG